MWIKSNVRELRKAAGIKYKDITWAMSSTTICHAQKDEGIANMPLKSLMKLSNLLGCCVNDLYSACYGDKPEKTGEDMGEEESTPTSEIGKSGETNQ